MAKCQRSFFDAGPRCVRCKAKGRLVPATVVDHITPHRGDAKREIRKGGYPVNSAFFVLLILAFCLYDEEKAIELDAPNDGDRKADRPGSICNPYGEGHHNSSHTQNGGLRF